MLAYLDLGSAIYGLAIGHDENSMRSDGSSGLATCVVVKRAKRGVSVSGGNVNNTVRLDSEVLFMANGCCQRTGFVQVTWFATEKTPMTNCRKQTFSNSFATQS